ncbi:MAG TPA: GNAT family N-acetyltransferase [Candidatus Thermoplasmatota archaeon]|nr:GNAT family N-acetyltransferase [Candidatus Thermoplasmatota archaeon]
MASEVRFRRAGPNDLPRLQALLKEAFPMPAWPTDAPAWTEAHLRDLLANARVYVGEDEAGALVATGSLDQRTHLRHLAVAEPLRKQGLGSAFLGYLESEAASAGARMMTLTAEAEGALPRFYERAGFRNVGGLDIPGGKRYFQFRKALTPKLPEGVRRAREEDAEALSAFFARTYQENEKLGLQYYASAVAPEVVRHLLATSEVYVREEGGRILAAVALTPLVEVRRLSVDPAARGDGHAADLLAFALERGRAMGAAEARLEIDAGHPWLGGFYERRGFVELGTLTYDPGTPDEFRSRWFARPLLLSQAPEGSPDSVQ